MSAFDELAAIRPRRLFDGILARTVTGERSRWPWSSSSLTRSSRSTATSNEQLGIVLRGVLTLRIGDEERTLGPGETWCIAPNVVHSGHAGPDGAVVIDVFSPPRDDWEELERLAAGQPRWP